MLILLLLLFEAPTALATICLDVCTCRRVAYSALNRTLDTVDCSRIPQSLRARIALNETYGGNLAVILKGSAIYNTRQIEGLTTLDHLILLDLSHNRLRRFNNVIVKGRALRALILDDNGFDYIPALADYAFLTLDLLSLADNVIESFHDKAFRGLETLKTLNISNNRLSEIEQDSFYGLIELRVLDLSNNVISRIKSASFSSLVSLKVLKLRGNSLHILPEDVFRKTVNLEVLNLDWNRMESIQTKLFQPFRSLKLLDLSGNHFTRFTAGTFSRINVSRIRVTDLSHLVIIDNEAFMDLPSLTILELHDNHRLRYLSSQFITRCPNLRTIHCQNNKLQAFPGSLLDVLPEFHVLGLYGNPLRCDCNIYWLLENIYVERRVSLLQVENTMCTMPESVYHQPVYKLGLKDVEAQCKPTVVDLIPNEIAVFAGDTFTTDCRAVGQPSANISWVLADGTRLFSGSRSGTTAVSWSGTLLVSSVNTTHHGEFSCLAENSEGQSNQSMKVTVKSVQARLIVQHAREHSIHLTWSGTSREERYRITCTQVNKTVAEVSIQPYWRSYTLQNLKADSEYRICISMNHQGHYHEERCLLVRTTNGEVNLGVFSIKRYVVSVVISLALLFVLIITVSGLMYYRHQRNKKRLKHLYGDNMSQLFLSSVSSFGDVTTPVTYENAAATYDDVTDDENNELKNLTSPESEADGK